MYLYLLPARHAGNGLGRGYFLTDEHRSASLRAVAFIDGPNLFRSAKEAFGHTYPNYDPMSLAQAVCIREGWNLRQVRFYTGYPDSEDHPFWNHFWTSKFAQMGRQGIYVFSRMVRNFDGAGALIEQWLKNKDTILFLGVWERINNPHFNSPEFEGIRNEAGRNSFFLSAKKVDPPDRGQRAHCQCRPIRRHLRPQRHRVRVWILAQPRVQTLSHHRISAA